jgi:hypothetical protein
MTFGLLKPVPMLARRALKRSVTRRVAGGGAGCIRLGAELLAEDEEQST